ncbi:WxL domain-containing protein [Listeria costaricensis]|uniref:WxL domain-containing protein n=1 Tax=Listeria costaricensis TaxID=2026604 RepID=UPI0013C45098|nr:WxL domain-containing protein [Listeria costaricensis]
MRKTNIKSLLVVALIFMLAFPLYSFADNTDEDKAITAEQEENTQVVKESAEQEASDSEAAATTTDDGNTAPSESAADTQQEQAQLNESDAATTNNLKSSGKIDYETMSFSDGSKIEYGFSGNSNPSATKPYASYYDKDGNKVDFEFFKNNYANCTLLRAYSPGTADDLSLSVETYKSSSRADTGKKDAAGNSIQSITYTTNLAVPSGAYGYDFLLTTTLTPRLDGIIDVSATIKDLSRGYALEEAEHAGFIWSFDTKINNVNYPVKAIGDNKGMFIEDGTHQISFLTKDVESWTAGKAMDSDTYDAAGFVHDNHIFDTFNRDIMMSNSAGAVTGKEDDNLKYGDTVYAGSDSAIYLEWGQQQLDYNDSRTIDFAFYLGTFEPPTITVDQQSTVEITGDEGLEISGTWEDSSTSQTADFYYSIDGGEPVEYLSDYPDSSSSWAYTIPSSVTQALSTGKHTIQMYCLNTLNMESNKVSFDFVKGEVPKADPVPQTVSLGTNLDPADLVTNLSSGTNVVGFAPDGIPSTQHITGGTPISAKVVIQNGDLQDTVTVPVNVVYGDSLAIPSTQSGTDGTVLTLHHDSGEPSITATYGNNTKSDQIIGPVTVSYYHTNDAGNINYTEDGSHSYVFETADDLTTSAAFQSNYSSSTPYPSQNVRYGDIVIVETKAAQLYNDDDEHPSVPAMKDNKVAYQVTNEGFVPLSDIPLGELTIKHVDDLDFGTHSIPSTPTRYANQSSSCKVVVDDTRACEKSWHLSVAQTEKFTTSGGDELQQSLYYIPNGQTTGSSLVVDEPTDVYSYSSSSLDSHESTIKWDQNHGFFVQTAGNEPLANDYTTELEWTIIEAP